MNTRWPLGFIAGWVIFAPGISSVAADEPIGPSIETTAASTAPTLVKDTPDYEPTYAPVPDSPEDQAWHDARHAAKLDGKLTLDNMDLSAPMESDPRTPNYYYYRGHAVPMRLDVTRLAVRLRDAVRAEELPRLAAAAGVPISAAEDVLLHRWQLLTLANPLGGAADARAKIEALLKHASFEFAAPVFHSPLLADSWIVPTADILLRFHPEQIDAAADTLKLIAPELSVIEQQCCGLKGAYRLRGASRNGYDALATAIRLSGDARVKWANVDLLSRGRGDITPNDPEFSNQWALNNTGQSVNGTVGTDDVDMNAPEGWNLTPGVSSVRVLILDNGVQQDHPDINQNTGRDFTGGQADGVAGGGPGVAGDCHGTAVAGCVSARFNNSTGVVGIAPSCRVISARFCTATSNTTCVNNWNAQDSYTANALNWAVNNGVQVTNNSNSYGATANVIDDAYDNARGNGIINFASAGNNGTTTLGYPSSLGTVDAVSNVQSDGTLNSTSQRGTGLDWSAPGTNIRTADRTGSAGYSSTGDYAYVSGTSFSSPYAAGIAALIKSFRPNYSPSNIELAMSVGARDYGAAGYDTNFGFGFVTAYASLRAFTPANDLCYTATVIPSLTWNPAAINTVNATTSAWYEPQEDCEYNNAGVANSVWYEFTPPANGFVSFDTFGSDYDTVVAMFDGCNAYLTLGSSYFPIYANQVACNDDAGGGLQSQIVNAAVTGGTTYKIKVSKFGTTPGGGSLVVHFSFAYAPPPNDECGSATVIPGTSTSYAPTPYSTIGAGTSGGCIETPSSCGSSFGNGHSVWYRFTPTAGGQLFIDTFGSDFDTVLTVFNGTNAGCGYSNGASCVYPTEVACNDDVAPGNLPSQIYNLTLSGGQTYYIKIAAYSGNAGGSLDFNFVYVPSIPPNNGCGAPTDIIGNTFTVTGLDTSGADTTPGELQESCEFNNAGVSNSVWYAFTPPGDGVLDVDTQGSNYDTVLAVFQGDCATGVEVACNDDTAQNLQSQITGTHLSAGLPYLIKVSDYGDPNGGLLTLHVTFTPDPPPECLGTWTALAADPLPARGYHAMAYDTANAQTVLFGGWDGVGPVTDLRLLSGSTWTSVSPIPSPSARYAHAMAYDSLRGRVMVFGGYGAGYLNETWLWDGAAGTWTQMSPVHVPPERAYPQLAYDSQRDRMVLFGGHNGGTPLGDTWEWNGSDWTPVAADGPSPRYAPNMAYDSTRHRTVLFGGHSGVLETDTWEWDGASWTQSTATGPGARYAASMAYDATRAVTVLHAGGPTDTWEYDGNAWRRVSTGGPPTRTFSAMVYDSARAACVLVGGEAGGNVMRDDVWTWSGPGDDGPVWITGQPASAALCPGDPINLSVTAVGHGPLAYQWRLDGVDIAGATDATYSVPAATAGDVGVYTCVVTNLCSSMESIGAGVTFCVLGDLNCDGGVNAGDVPLFMQALLSPGGLTACQLDHADVNQDGFVNGLDVSSMTHLITGP